MDHRRDDDDDLFGGAFGGDFFNGGFDMHMEFGTCKSLELLKNRSLNPLGEVGIIIALLGMRTRIFCLAPASQCVNSPTEAARARALLTAREARLPTNLRARRKLTFLSVTN